MIDFFSHVSIIFPVLLLAALAGLACERAGIVNIGINGMMVFSALVFSLLGHFFGGKSNYLQIPALLITCIASSLFALLHGFACIKLKANQIVSGVAINMLASGIGLFCVNISSLSISNNIFTNFQLLAFDKSRISNIILILAVLIGILGLVFFSKTVFGMRYKSIGENPYSADSIGINVERTRYIAVAISGALAGLAGAGFTFYSSSAFQGNVQGEGFIALAILIFGQWKVELIFIGSLFFSLFEVFAAIMPMMQNVPQFISNNAPLFATIPFILTIISMIIVSKKSKAPAALGIPFNKEKR